MGKVLLKKTNLDNVYFLRWMSSGILIVSYGFLLSYWFFYSKFQVNSDAFVADALANSILTHGSFMPKEFAFANGDFLVYYHHTFLLFLNSFVSSPATAHNIASVILGTIFLFSVYLFVRQLGASINRALLILSFVSTGLSSQITDWLFGQAGYSVLITMNLFFLSMFLKIISDFHQTNNYQIKFYKILFVVLPLGILLLTNPFRFIFSFAIPFLLAIFSLLPHPDTSFRLVLQLIKKNLLQIIFAFFPFIVFRVLFEMRSSSTPGILGTGFRDYNNFLDGPKNVLLGAIQLLGILPPAGTPMLSTNSIISVIRIATVLVLFTVLKKWLSNKGSLRGSHDFVWIFTKSALLLQLALLVFTNISIDFYCGRYFLPQLFVILLFVLAKWDLNILSTLKIERFLAVILLTLFGLTSIHSVIILDRTDYFARMHLVQRLEKLDIAAVNATYWNSARNQNISNNRVKFNTVYLDPEKCISEYWWVNDRKPLDTSIPLILTQPEYNLVASNPVCVEYLVGTKVEQISSYFIIRKN
jgi:hypothetical protein